MIRALFLLIVIAAGFGGGFYAGVEYRDQQIKADPKLFLQEFGQVFEETAKEKYEKIKKVILED